SFAAPQAYELTGEANSIVTGDFDNDGRLDIATAVELPRSIVVLFGNGDGTFQPRSVIELEQAPIRLTAGRFDAVAGDDLAYSSLALTTVPLLLGRGDRSFDRSRSIDIGRVTLSLNTADFDGDGHDDVVS